MYVQPTTQIAMAVIYSSASQVLVFGANYEIKGVRNATDDASSGTTPTQEVPTLDKPGSAGIVLVKQRWNGFGTMALLGWKVNPGRPAFFRELESNLFIVRTWRAHIRHVPGGEDRYVRTWRDLEIFLGQYNGLSDPNDQSIK
jgi:hypothetical protein